MDYITIINNLMNYASILLGIMCGYFAAFVIGINNGLPKGALPDPWAKVPLFSSQGDSLTLPTCEGQ